MRKVRQIQELFGRYELHVKNVIDRNNIFLRKYSKLSERLESHKADFYKARFTGLIAGYKLYDQSVRKKLKENATDYNIFNVLKIKRKEAITHTPFLADLLNPQGSHFQDDLFLKEFIKNLLNKHPNYDNFYSFQPADIEVVDEKHIPNGFIDIFIHSRQRGNQFAIIIENKIDAGDQKRQLERYWNYARKQLRLNEEQIALIYLNKQHKIPEDNFSINEELKNRLITENKLLCMSYQPQIYDFLISMSDKIKADNIKQIIKQYLQVIKDF